MNVIFNKWRQLVVMSITPNLYLTKCKYNRLWIFSSWKTWFSLSLQQIQDLFPPPVGVPPMGQPMQVVNYSCLSSSSCIWKEQWNQRWRSAFQRLNWLSMADKADLDECVTPMSDSGPAHCFRPVYSRKSHCFYPPEPFKQIKAQTKPSEAPGTQKHRNYSPL